MFGFLKDKLKSALSVFSRKVDEEGKEEVKEEIKEENKSSKKEENKVEKKEEKKSEKKQDSKSEKKEKKKSEKKEVNKEEKKGIKRTDKEEKVEVKKEKVFKKEPEEIKQEIVEEKKQEVGSLVVEEKKGFFSKLKEKFVSKAPEVQEQKVELVEKEDGRAEKKEEKEIVKGVIEEEIKEEISHPEIEEKKGFFASIKEKITTKTISAEQFDELFWDLELVLLENNVAVEVIEKIKNDLKSELVNKPIHRSQIEQSILVALRNSVSTLFDFPPFNLIESAKSKKPFIVCLVGVNGSGKTTTVAKLVKLFEKNGLSCVIAAADTFRASPK